MGAILSPRQIAQIAAEVIDQRQLHDQRLADGVIGDADLERLPIEMWLDHFVAESMRNDYVMANWWDSARTDTTTAAFQQQLEALLAQTYDKQYPGLKARNFIPLAPGIPTGAETVATVGYDIKGEATELFNYGEDIRRVELDGVKTTWNIIGIAASWMITIQQLRAAAMMGADINGKGLMAARNFIDRKIDAMLTVGVEGAGINGFTNLTTGANGVPILNKSGTLTGDWEAAGTTAAQVLADCDLLFTEIEDTNIWQPTDFILDTQTYYRLSRLQLNTAGTLGTVKQYLEDNYEVKVHKWNKLNLADSAGTGPRCILYQNTDDVVSGVVSQEPEQLPSVWGGIGWETIMHARCGGVKVENPKGMAYADHQV